MIAPLLVETGKPVSLSGYAEDYGKQIMAVEFSLDNGLNWTSHDVSSSNSDLWVYWTFSYTPQRPGTYHLLVRSINEDGKTSPSPDLVEFVATEKGRGGSMFF